MSVLDEMLTAGIRKEHLGPISIFSYRVGLMVFIAFSMGLLSFAGFDGFARAGEVDQKIIAAVKPITQALEKAAQEQSSYRLLLLETLTTSKAAEIRALALKRCKATISGDRSWLNEEIERRQSEYERLKNRRYDVPACNEL